MTKDYHAWCRKCGGYHNNGCHCECKKEIKRLKRELKESADVFESVKVKRCFT